jgi:adenylosuccinate lyase
MTESALMAISPIDGRYFRQTQELSNYFSEFGLIRYRLFVEIEYFIELCELPLPELAELNKAEHSKIRAVYKDFNIQDALRIKEIEKTTNHDVKAVEYFIKEKFDQLGLEKFREFVHFGLTSQDINNTAIPLSVSEAIYRIYIPALLNVIGYLEKLAEEWKEIPMLARTHGQPASPTLLGKEFLVFTERLNGQVQSLAKIPIEAKFGGATGNLNAHYAAYPEIDWVEFADKFLARLQLQRQMFTTQIEHYDQLAALFDNIKRINTIFIDFCRDIWTYISMDYFGQKISANEVGSSAMPHKVNPIDFENAEGNLGMANALFEHLSSKLPVSRLQRDLTDSTVTRNIGVPVAHSLIAIKSIEKGIHKLILNQDKINSDLEQNWVVVSEAIQTVLRKSGYPKPYEALKELTRNDKHVSQADMNKFIDSLDITTELKNYLKSITPFNYTGKS